jgi:hypothetical protein
MVNFWVDIRIQPHFSRRRPVEAKVGAAAGAEDILEQQESYLVDKLP